jgi:hypothetical protein
VLEIGTKLRISILSLENENKKFNISNLQVQFHTKGDFIELTTISVVRSIDNELK